MNYDSYEMTGVRVTVNLINRFSAGTAYGSSFAGEMTVEALKEILKDDPPSVAQVSTDHLPHFESLVRHLRHVVEQLVHGHTDTAAAQLNRILRTHPATPELDRDPDGRWRLHHHPLNADLASMWSAICAEGLAREIGNQNMNRFGVCSAHTCDRIFFDTSRNAKRCFCSPACQNRAKAAAFRARHAEQPGKSKAE